MLACLVFGSGPIFPHPVVNQELFASNQNGKNVPGKKFKIGQGTNGIGLHNIILELYTPANGDLANMPD